MCKLLVSADLIVCRPGAITLAEMATVRLPGILIPSPNVANDHQTPNALAYEKMGSCVVIKESDLDIDKLANLIRDLIKHPERLQSMRKAYEPYIKENALSTIVSLIYDYNIK